MLTGVAGVTVAAVLAVGLVGHVRRPRALADALRAHRVLPRHLAAIAAAAGPVLEGAIGFTGGAATLLGRAELLRLAMIAAAVVLAAYAAYSRHVLRTRPTVPCGCAGSETSMSGWVVVRAVALGLLATAVAVKPLPVVSADGSQLVITLLAGATFAVLIWQLPAALHDPERTRTA
jgi:hypothetical protein